MLNLYGTMSPLLAAARGARVDDVQRMLVAEGFDANEVDEKNRSALYWVCRSSMDRAQTILRIVDLLLQRLQNFGSFPCLHMRPGWHFLQFRLRFR